MITLIGIGPGGPESLTIQAKKTIERADLLMGADRMLSALPESGAERIAVYLPDEILSVLETRHPRTPCVLYSGDPGFWSGASLLVRRLEEKNIPFRVLPGLSSVQVLAARLGRDWKDWTFLSAHGQYPDILSRLKAGRPVFCLTGGKDGPAALCRQLTDAGLGDLTITVGEDLSYPGERVTTASAGSLTERTFAPLNVVLAESAEHCPSRTPGLPDSAFLRGDTPMTKQEVRAVLLSKLAVRPSDVCWDIGAGTGSVSVELALCGKEVWAVEQDAEACALIRKNRTKFCAWNLRLVQGRAPEALDALPPPDKVFVGGSEGQLRPILRAACEKNPNLRVCISAITLETAHEAMEELSALGLEPEAVQLSVSRTRRAGRKHLLLAQNPVFLVVGGPE